MLDIAAVRVRQRLTWGSVGFIALPYSIVVAMLLHEHRFLATLPEALALAFMAVGWRELKTLPAVIAAAVSAISALSAVVFSLVEVSDLGIWLVPIALGPAILAIAGGLALIQYQVIGAAVMLFIGAAITIVASADSIRYLGLVKVVGLVCMGFGFTLAGSALLTFRPLPPSEATPHA